LHRHLAQLGLTGRTTRSAAVHRRFEAEGPGDLWQSDEAFFRFPAPAEGRTTVDRLFVFIDDHSRLIPHAQLYPEGSLLNLEHAFKRAIAKCGAPGALYVDHGKVYIAQQLTRACAHLGIRLLHAEPYHPESKGKIERVIGTLRSALYPELRDAAYPTRQQRNAALWAWIDEVYHRTPHSETGHTPLERFTAGGGHIRRPSDEELHQAFLFRDRRHVTKACILKLGGRRYEMPPVLARQQVEVRFDPADPDHRIGVYIDGNLILHATPTTPAPRRPRRIAGPTARPSSGAGRRYLDQLARGRRDRLGPKPLAPPTRRPDDGRLALVDLLDFLRGHRLPIGPRHERLAARFLDHHGPFDKEAALACVRKALHKKGAAQHLRYYLEALRGAPHHPGDTP
jgi:transposase InsO family protein